MLRVVSTRFVVVFVVGCSGGRPAEMPSNKEARKVKADLEECCCRYADRAAITTRGDCSSRYKGTCEASASCDALTPMFPEDAATATAALDKLVAGGTSALALAPERGVAIADFTGEDPKAHTVHDECDRKRIEAELAPALARLRENPPGDSGIAACTALANDRVLCAYAESLDTVALLFDIVDDKANLYALAKIVAVPDGEHMGMVRERTMALAKRPIARCTPKP
jgi:hypothetical protein